MDCRSGIHVCRRYSVFGAFNTKFESVHALLDLYYSGIEAHKQHAELYHSLNIALTQRLKKLETKVMALKKQLDASFDAEKMQKEAHLIIANLHRQGCGEHHTF